MVQPTRTKNQHFISQAEQRLNCCNPAAAPERQKVFSFLVEDRDACKLRLELPGGVKIRNNLAWTDLFTFDSTETSLLQNLEAWFQAYEQIVAVQSSALLKKLETDGKAADIRGELVNVFAAKLLNFLRNPYSVTKVLNTIRPAIGYRPTDPRLAEAFRRIVAGGQPQQRAVCERFGLNPSEYWNWLQALFLILARDPRTPMNVFEGLVKDLFEKNYVMVFVYHYTTAEAQHVCFLSDRGHNTRYQDAAKFGIDFNIASNAFAHFAFCDVDGLAPTGFNPEAVAHLKAIREVGVQYVQNDLEQLVRYNRLTVYQCFQRVYAASAAVAC